MCNTHDEASSNKNNGPRVRFNAAIRCRQHLLPGIERGDAAEFIIRSTIHSISDCLCLIGISHKFVERTAHADKESQKKIQRFLRRRRPVTL